MAAGVPPSHRRASRTIASMRALRAALDRVRESSRTSGRLWTAAQVLHRAGLPAMRLFRDRRVAPEILAAQLAGIFRAWGMSDEHVAITVEHVLYSDLHGIDSHGAAMLVDYHRKRLAGELEMRPKIAVVGEDAATALVDGGGGLGHVAADLAMRLAIGKAAAHGVGAVAVRNSGHFGAAGSYAALAAREGCLGLVTTTTARPSVVPTFGREARLGTNPIAFAAPALRNRPFLLDMATSAAPLGKLYAFWRRGRAIPAGWAIDAAGRTERDGRHAAEGRRLLPLGSTPELASHKGYGLAAMVEILAGVLPGVGAVDAGSRRVGHFVIALDPRRFRAAGELEGDLDALLDALRASTPLDPRQPVRVAGDPEYAAAEANRRDGIPLARAVVEDLRAVCLAAGVPFRLGTGA